MCLMMIPATAISAMTLAQLSIDLDDRIAFSGSDAVEHVERAELAWLKVERGRVVAS